jgi:hypothetical protein
MQLVDKVFYVFLCLNHTLIGFYGISFMELPFPHEDTRLGFGVILALFCSLGVAQPTHTNPVSHWAWIIIPIQNSFPHFSTVIERRNRSSCYGSNKFNRWTSNQKPHHSLFSLARFCQDGFDGRCNVLPEYPRRGYIVATCNRHGHE